MEMNYKEILNRIDTLIFDVDGVFTDGTAILIEGQQPLRTVHARDTYAIQLAVKKGYRVVIITGGSAEEVRYRFETLGVKDIFLKSRDKVKVYDKYCETHGLDGTTILYMGDDIPDYNVMKKVALPCCPSDAVTEIKSVSKYISHINGGKGCVREIIEQVMRVKGEWFDADAHVW